MALAFRSWLLPCLVALVALAFRLSSMVWPEAPAGVLQVVE